MKVYIRICVYTCVHGEVIVQTALVSWSRKRQDWITMALSLCIWNICWCRGLHTWLDQGSITCRCDHLHVSSPQRRLYPRLSFTIRNQRLRLPWVPHFQIHHPEKGVCPCPSSTTESAQLCLFSCLRCCSYPRSVEWPTWIILDLGYWPITMSCFISMWWSSQCNEKPRTTEKWARKRVNAGMNPTVSAVGRVWNRSGEDQWGRNVSASE